MRNLLIDVFDAFEKRIAMVQDILSSSNSLIENYRQQRQTIDSQLRTQMAQSNSLRKKDFDGMMSKVRDHYFSREKELKTVLQKFIDDHQSMIQEIRKSLLSTHANRVPNIVAFHKRFESIKREQEEREAIIRNILFSYEREHQSFSNVMGHLIDNSNVIYFHDFKNAIDHLLTQNAIKINA